MSDTAPEKANKVKPIPLLFGDFEAAEQRALKLIPKFHSHLGSAKIRYICRNKAAKRAGSLIPGNIYKMSGKYAFLTGYNFVMEIALEVWNDYNDTQRTALVDHLLTRCVGEENEEDGEMKWRVQSPIVQEFPEVAERNGQWNESLIDLGSVFKSQNDKIS
jgi:hypothetical protein